MKRQASWESEEGSTPTKQQKLADIRCSKSDIVREFFDSRFPAVLMPLIKSYFTFRCELKISYQVSRPPHDISRLFQIQRVNGDVLKARGGTVVCQKQTLDPRTGLFLVHEHSLAVGFAVLCIAFAIDAGILFCYVQGQAEDKRVVLVDVQKWIVLRECSVQMSRRPPLASWERYASYTNDRDNPYLPRHGCRWKDDGLHIVDNGNLVVLV